jgi:hypothetical protein
MSFQNKSFQIRVSVTSFGIQGGVSRGCSHLFSRGRLPPVEGNWPVGGEKRRRQSHEDVKQPSVAVSARGVEGVRQCFSSVGSQ